MSAVDLRDYAWIVINSSAGKDSQAMTEVVVRMADAAGVRDRLVLVHCDLGRVEWQGTVELAAEHALHYDLRFEIVQRDRDLLHQIEHERGMFPIPGKCFGTSDHKTSQVSKLHTALAAESRAAGAVGPVRILDCLGLRRDESDKRAKRLDVMVAREGFAIERAWRSSRNLCVDKWYPIADVTLPQVWATIRAAGTRHHWAYDVGAERLSCCFCIMASDADLRVAARHNPDLAREYLRIEAATGHDFRHKHPLREVLADIPLTARRDGRVHLTVAA